MVKSTQARNKINQWYKNEYKADNLQKGKAAMEDYCRAKGINLSELLVPDFMEKTLKRYNYTEWDTLMAAVGHGGLREGQIVNRLLEEKRRVEEKNRSDSDVLEEIRDKKNNEEYESPKGTIKVRGIHDVAVRFSKCCSPVPGDDIVGFVTRGRGISIHRTDCINVVNMSETDRVRLIDAEWVEAEGKSNFEFTTEINVYAMERNGLIFDLSKVFNEEDISIKGMLARTSKAGKSTIDISFNVKSKGDLNRLVSKIRNIQGVLDIQRPQG
jgi:GTP pyrophosphokinase